jgi:hypothetical protein
MFSKIVALALVLSSVTSAAPALQGRQDPCQDAFNVCIAAGSPAISCSCTLIACVGDDNARNSDYCASATATLSKPTSSGTPSSVFNTTTATPVATFTSILSISSSYFLTTTMAPAANATSTSGIPTSAVPAPIATAAPGSNPVLVSPPKSWTLSNLTRYCNEGNTGCDYNFAVTADGKTDLCTVIRMPGSNAATESWANQECSTGSDLTISWGYVAEPAPAFAVVTVVKGAELAWFGVSNINGGQVTPSSPFGSGDYGTSPAAPVYTYN